jgi:hypothetical protein
LVWFGFAMLGVEPGASQMLGKHSTTESHSQSCLCFEAQNYYYYYYYYFKTGSDYIAKAGLKWIREVHHHTWLSFEF